MVEINMKIKQTQIFVVLFASLILGCTIITVIPIGIEQSDDIKSDTLNLSTVDLLDYMDYVLFTAPNVGPSGSVEWSFSSSTSYIGIIVFAMDKTNYNIFKTEDYLSAEGYVLSNGNYILDYGTWVPVEKRTWYIVFFNMDPDQDTTTLTWDAECFGCSSGGGGPNIALIIGIVVAVIAIAAVAGFLVYKYKIKPGREPKVPPEGEPKAPVAKEEPKPTEIVDGVRNVFEVSGNRIDLEMLRDIVPMDKAEFNSKVLDLAKQYGFKIELEVLHISDEKRDDFINALINALQK